MRPCISLCRGAAVFAVFFILPLRRFWGNTCNRLRLRHDIMYFLQIENQNLSITELKLRLSLCRICLSSPKMQNPLQMWTTHCLKPMGFLLHRPRNLLSPQALIWAVPALYIISYYAICLNPSASIFFAALISLSCFIPQFGHIHSLTHKSFVSVFWYPQAKHNWLPA